MFLVQIKSNLPNKGQRVFSEVCNKHSVCACHCVFVFQFAIFFLGIFNFC